MTFKLANLLPEFPVGTSLSIYATSIIDGGEVRPLSLLVPGAGIVAADGTCELAGVPEGHERLVAAALLGGKWSVRAFTIAEQSPEAATKAEVAKKLTAPTGPESQDTLLYDGAKWVRLAKGLVGQLLGAHSDGSVQWTNPPEVIVDFHGVTPANSSAANTAAMKALIEACGPGTTFRFGPGLYKLGELGEVLKEKRNISFIGSNYVVDTTGGTLTYSGIIFTGEHVCVDLGTFTTTPANYWQGKSQGFSLEKLMLYSEVGNSQAPGERTTIFVRDNGCGNVTTRDCQFLNFQYGIASPYGSDFSSFDRLKFSLCDLGIYLGPGSGEVYVGKIEYDRCREGFVADSCQQGYMVANSWDDNAICDVKFEYLTTTRFGLTGERNGLNDMSWVLESNKHESNAGGTGVVWSTAPIQTYTDRTDKSYPRGLTIRKPRLIAGGAESTTRAFLEATTGKNLVVDSPSGQGVAVHYWINRGESFAPRLRNPHTADGTAEILPFRNENFECLTIDEFKENSLRGATSGAVVTWINTEGVKFQWLFNGATVKLNYWTGSAWVERMAFDPQNAIIKLREAELVRKAEKVFGLGATTHFQPNKFSAAEAKNETLYIDSTSGKLMFKNSAGESKEL